MYSSKKQVKENLVISLKDLFVSMALIITATSGI